MKNFLNTLFDDFPELKNDRKKIEKLVYLLDKNKPNIEASKNFKKDLRQRVQNYSELKSTSSKKIYLLFFVPAISFCFAVFGLAYFSDDFFIFDKSNDYSKIIQEDNIWEEKIEEISAVRNMTFIEQENTGDEYAWEKNIPEEDNFETQEVMMINQDNESEVENNNQEKKYSEDEIFVDDTSDKKINNNDTNIEEDQMMMQAFMMDSSVWSNEKSEFELYCELENWTYWFEDDSFYCEIEQKICYEKDFENGVCEKFE